MTPKQKAVWLVDFFNRFNLTTYEKKECALMCVDEIINIGSNPNNPTGLYYWNEVKQEINKL